MLTITAKKETTVRKLTTEKRTTPEVVIAHCLDFPLFSQQNIGHPKHADQNFSRASGYRKVHTNNACQGDGNRKIQWTTMAFMHTIIMF